MKGLKIREKNVDHDEEITYIKDDIYIHLTYDIYYVYICTHTHTYDIYISMSSLWLPTFALHLRISNVVASDLGYPGGHWRSFHHALPGAPLRVGFSFHLSHKLLGGQPKIWGLQSVSKLDSSSQLCERGIYWRDVSCFGNYLYY